MQQTMLALCAVAVFSIYALNSTRDEAAMDLRAVTSEGERAAEAVARERLAAAERVAFDEQDIGRTTGVRITPPTSRNGPDAGETAPAHYDDLGDFHGLAETRAADTIGGPGGLLFDVSYVVRYVAPSTLAAAAAAVPTLANEFAVSVVEVPSAATRGRPQVRVTLRKVFTPAGMASLR